MKRLRRFLFKVLAAASAPMLVLTCVLWVRSYWFTDSWYTRGTPYDVTQQPDGTNMAWDRQWSVYLDRGLLMARREERPAMSLAVPGHHSFPVIVQDPISRAIADRTRKPWILQQQRGPRSIPGGGYVTMYGELGVQFPIAFLAALLAILPTIALIQTRQRIRRSRIGKCLKCGYDMRATPDRCPECGTMAIAPTKR